MVTIKQTVGDIWGTITGVINPQLPPPPTTPAGVTGFDTSGDPVFAPPTSDVTEIVRRTEVHEKGGVK